MTLVKTIASVTEIIIHATLSILIIFSSFVTIQILMNYSKPMLHLIHTHPIATMKKPLRLPFLDIE